MLIATRFASNPEPSNEKRLANDPVVYAMRFVLSPV